MSAYCFMRHDKIKTVGSFTRKMEHNFRLEKVPNADESKLGLNEELIKMTDANYVEAYKRKIAESPVYKDRRPRKDAVKGIEVMLTYAGRNVGHEFDMDGWKRANVEWLQETFGKDNVVSAILHNDEQTPHIHAIVIPMVDGKLRACEYLNGKNKTSGLQTSYAVAMAPFGLSRGLQHSTASHTKISRFYAALNQELEKELPPIREGESAAEYRERANEIYVNSNCQHLDELYQEQRKNVEAQTGALDDKIGLFKKVSELEQRERELIAREKKIDVLQKKADRLDELLGGLKNGCLPDKERVEFEDTMMMIAKWERERLTAEKENRPELSDSITENMPTSQTEEK